MASFVLSECGLRPLPRIYPNPRTGQNSLISNPSKLRISRNVSPIDSSRGVCRERNWALKVSAPLRFQQLEEEKDNHVDEFDPGAPPPFKLSDIRAAIPKHCWVKNPWRSMSYVVRDVAVVFGLAAVAAYFNSWAIWPLYWLAQGTMFWALFVLGHDWYSLLSLSLSLPLCFLSLKSKLVLDLCSGHGSFSNDPKLNSVAGHLLHSSILVPYHGWYAIESLFNVYA